MATQSPTPAAGLVRRTSQRQALRRIPSRSTTNRSESQSAHSGSAHAQQQYARHDAESSEDEIPVPMVLSALTKALLEDDPPEKKDASRTSAQQIPPLTRRRTSNISTSASAPKEKRRALRSSSAQPDDVNNSILPSPKKEKEPSPPKKRVVRLSHTPNSLSQIAPAKRRSVSTTRSNQRSSVQPPSRPTSRTGHREKPAEERSELESDINTPPPAGRVVRIVTGSSGNRSRMGSMQPSSGRSISDRSGAERSPVDAEFPEYGDPNEVAREAPPVSIGSIRNPSNINKGRQDELPNPQSTARVKRVGKLAGSFLSGPARRGRRRQSEEDGENGEDMGQEPEAYAVLDRAATSFYSDNDRDFNSGSPISGSAAARATHRRKASNADFHQPRLSPSQQERESEQANNESLHRFEAQQSRPDSPHRPELPSAHDQENEVLASTKRKQRSSVDQMLDKIPHRPRPVMAEINLAMSNTDRPASPERKPLSLIRQITPHRSAPPPPPKMSVLEAATSTAGAATTTQKARRNVMKLNGKAYTRLDCLGRGGSAKVYRVSAENGKMFALKRVSLEGADESTMRGYKGEIDLLGKLSGVDRVINLFDYELNEERNSLTLLMEMGELDLNTLLRKRVENEQNSDAVKFDPVFVRFYWKEMLECLQSVHQFDIVHSDLKPANFVLVRGQLKLIDFGIANAIQTDETVNVHRENQIGTPNYMSPESLMDSNPRAGHVRHGPKLVKLGKPSDVWSLGCILYQMVYGVPPFGHISNQMARCQAIINWDHAIEFPSRAMGGVPVPPSLIRTMKRCLIRDQHMRPTVAELLYETDPFLYPVEFSDRATPIDEELLGRIIQSVVTRCRERMPTDTEINNEWPRAYWSHVRKAVANQR